MIESNKDWIGVDLDGTLAVQEGPYDFREIGDPIVITQWRVHRWLKEGKRVKIFTARVSPVSAKYFGYTVEKAKEIVEEWCLKHLGQKLEVTHEKDCHMIQYWDDLAVRVEVNTGEII